MDRKAKIREYKETQRPMGVYRITNKENGKVFIGSSKDLTAILNRHRSELKIGSHRNKVMQEEWRQYGPEAFEFEQLELLEPLDDSFRDPSDDLLVLEEMWLEKLSPFGDRGYNKPVKASA